MVYLKRLLSRLFSQKDCTKNKAILSAKYYQVYNRKLDFDYVDTFSAYIQHCKVSKKSEELGVFVDKYAVRTHVANLIGEKYLAKLLGVWKNAKDIDYDSLPSRFVLKANHGSSWNIIVPDIQKLDRKVAQKKLNWWLAKSYFKVSLEPHYRKIKPKIIAEEFLVDSNGEILDYKFFCFYGKSYFIQVDIGRYTENHSRIYYDMDWRPLPFTIKFPRSHRTLKRPENWDEMLKIVNQLAKGHEHVRVDLYNIDGRIVFGELTFTHHSGLEKFYPDDTYNFLIGDIIAKRKTLTDWNQHLSSVNNYFSI